MGVKFLCLLLALCLVGGQQTPDPGCPVIDASVLGNTEAPSQEGAIAASFSLGQGLSPPLVQLLAFRSVCLAPAASRDLYRFASVIANFSCEPGVLCPTNGGVGGSNFSAQFDFECLDVMTDGAGPRWVASLFGGSYTSPPDGTFSTLPRTDCAFCVNPSPSVAGVLGLSPDVETHCQECPAVCGLLGLGLCFGFTEAHCCSYYDEGVCVGSCGENQEPAPGASFECVCSGFWREPDCSECDLPCDVETKIPNPDTCLDCICPPGLTGLVCEQDVDECTVSNPCANGECVNTLGSYACTCDLGYGGRRCDIAEPCQTAPCLNRGTCVDIGGDYVCRCLDDFTGRDCETQICSPGFTGGDCSLDIDECLDLSDLCANGGTCVNTLGSYECDCVGGFTGPNCETDIDECSPTNPCLNGGLCIDGLASFGCNCAEGWEGPTCAINVNINCSPNPCLNGGSCVDRGTAYVCDCAENWGGVECGLCTIQNCALCTGVPATCAVCQDGFERRQDTSVCDPVIGPSEQVPEVWAIAVLSALGAGLACVLCLVCTMSIVNYRLLQRRTGKYAVSRAGSISLDEFPGHYDGFDNATADIDSSDYQVPGPHDHVDLRHLTTTIPPTPPIPLPAPHHFIHTGTPHPDAGVPLAAQSPVSDFKEESVSMEDGLQSTAEHFV